ncbi:MAG TPA: GFA family protein [Gammaproteobacteria bacterium]
MNAQTTRKGSCFCGDVEVTVTGDPVAMGYCHCESCRHWSAGPVNAFSLWKPEAVAVTRGADKLGSYSKTPQSIRKWCKTCGGHVLTEHPTLGVTDVYAAVLPDLEFKPALHVFYRETVLPMKDGLTKMKDLPAEFGGSGETMPAD